MKRNPRDITGAAKLNYIATLINPVDHRLYDIIGYGQGVEMYVVTPLPNDAYKDDRPIAVYGNGSYDTDEEFEHDGMTYYRSHTPSGVKKKKSGLGLMLYSGLSLSVVKYEAKEGVFSQLSQRSSEATQWWKDQVDRGFAYQEGDYISGQEQVEIRLDEEMIDKCDLDPEECAADIDDIEPGYVTVYVDFTKERLVQVLPAGNVVNARLVLAWDEDDLDLDSLLEDSEGPPTEVLLGLDMSTTADPNLLINILQRLEGDPKVTKKALQNFVNKYPGPLKGAESSMIRELLGQQKFPFEEVVEAVEEEDMVANPVKNSRAWKDYFGDLAKPVGE